MENDGAAAVILTTAERARDLKQKPAYVMAAAQGSDYRQGCRRVENAPDYAILEFQDARAAAVRDGGDRARATSTSRRSTSTSAAP